MTASATSLRGMARIEARQTDLAESISIDALTLHAWYGRQVAHQRSYMDRLEAAWKAAMVDKKLEDRDSPLWRKFWVLEARRRYAIMTMGLLAQRQHVIVCPVDGIPSVIEASEWPQGHDVFAALSLRGMLDGGDRFSWERYCEAHTPAIETESDKLYREWKSPNLKPHEDDALLPVIRFSALPS